MKQWISIVLSVLMCVGCFVPITFAAEESETELPIEKEEAICQIPEETEIPVPLTEPPSETESISEENKDDLLQNEEDQNEEALHEDPLENEKPSGQLPEQMQEEMSVETPQTNPQETMQENTQEINSDGEGVDEQPKRIRSFQEAAVANIYRPKDVENIEIIEGNIREGTLQQLSLEDRKSIAIECAPSGAVSVELLFQVADPAMEINQMFLRTSMKCSEDTQVDFQVWDFNAEQYVSIGSVGIGAKYSIEDISIACVPEYIISNQGQVKIRLNSVDSLVCLDQVQFVCGTIAKEQPQNYKVDSAVVEQGNLQQDSKFENLTDRDDKVVNVASENNKVAWYTTVTLREPKEHVDTFQIDYAGKTSVSANDIWLSLYRFDTQNWETIAVLPANTEMQTRMILLSGNNVQSYISDDNDIRIRLYNSAEQAFVRKTDFLSVTALERGAAVQEICNPISVVTEYGNSTNDQTALQMLDENWLITESDGANKAATQLNFQISSDVNRIEELTIRLRMKSKQDVNTQYISLLNQNTGKYVVVKSQSGSASFEEITVTLDSLYEIRKYIGPTGEITARIYNSASSGFSRCLDYAQLLVTSGDFRSFTIAQVSDVHELIGTDNFKAIIDELNNSVKPEFTIVTGDISDHGTPEQYALYLEDKKLLKGPVYTTPGNHDVRWWNANGKKTFTDAIGPLYQSFDYGGVHFVLLDSTVNFELDGKINKEQQQWLKNDLKGIDPQTPCILFAHHPFKINNNVTARHELIDAVKDRNAVAYMCGHVHYYGNVVENGLPVNYITFVKDNGNQEFVTIEFTPNYYYIYKHKAIDHSKTLWLTGKMNNTRKMDLSITDVKTLANGMIEVKAKVQKAPDGVASMQARVDNYGPYTQFVQNTDGTWAGQIDPEKYTPELVSGKHFVGVEAIDNNGYKWIEYKDYEDGSAGLTKDWSFETGDMIQSTPTIFQQKVYVGSEDKNLYCIDADSGNLLWKYTTQGPVISKPALCTQGSVPYVVFGSQDENVYCLDAVTGELIWKMHLSGSVLSDPLVNDTKVYIGCGDGKIYCLSCVDGQILWSYQTNGLMRQRPIIDKGVLYAFVRDTFIWYALNAETGELVWRGNAGTDESLFVCGDVRPVIAGGKLWCIDAQNTRPGCLDLTSGQLEWTGDLPKVSSRGMATDGKLVFYTSNNGRQITAYDAFDRTIVWQHDLRYGGKDRDLQEMQIDCGLICEQGVLYHVAERGRITAMDASNGNILWQKDAAGFPERVFWSTPEIGEGKILCGGIDGKLYSVELPN